MSKPNAETAAIGPLSFSVDAFEIQQRFATPLLVAPVNDFEAVNAALLARILAKAAEDPGASVSNEGGWQSAGDFAEWGGPAGEALLEAARKLADVSTAVEEDGALTSGGPAWRMNAWANVNRPGDFNRRHHHPAAFWSGVYWVDDGFDGEADAGGEFEMLDPRGVLPAFYAPSLRYAVPGGLAAGREDFFRPRTGTMILFPAWLTHGVRPYRGDRVRVSIAFNLSV